jgi:hypothetical protein
MSSEISSVKLKHKDDIIKTTAERFDNNLHTVNK